MRNRLVALCAALLAAVLLVACNTPQHTHTAPPPAKTVPIPASVDQACPQALGGVGAMGECAPPAVKSKTASASSAVHGGITYPDFSNNDPCYCAGALKAHGRAGEIDKANQGTGFIDRTFVPMVTEAHRLGLAVGGYDFDQEYTAQETYAFIGRLHAAGIYRNTPRTFPPTLDVEFGSASIEGLKHQVAVLKREYGRVQIYTGAWYWLPHFGCWVPPGVSFWLSGYPIAQLLCGLKAVNWQAHQFTDHGYTGASQVPFADLSLYIGRSFAQFIQATKSPAQIKAAKVRSLRAHEQLRAELHGDIDRHHCRLTPPTRGHARPPSYHTVCGRWLREGRTATAVINRYHREGIR